MFVDFLVTRTIFFCAAVSIVQSKYYLTRRIAVTAVAPILVESSGNRLLAKQVDAHPHVESRSFMHLSQDV